MIRMAFAKATLPLAWAFWRIEDALDGALDPQAPCQPSAGGLLQLCRRPLLLLGFTA